MKIRLEGTEPELTGAVEDLRKIFQIRSVSKLYKNRNSELYRVYVEAASSTVQRFSAEEEKFFQRIGMEVYCSEPNRVLDDESAGDPPLTPSYHGEECLGNGSHPDYKCCCDECSHYLICFPNWKEQG